jgi:hypothetical protein
MFPALIEPVHHPVEKQKGAVTVNGTTYLVGENAELAQTTYDPSPYVDRGFHGSREQYVQICYVLDGLGLDGEQESLVCSLPYKEHLDAELRKRITERQVFEWTDHSGRRRSVRFANVYVTPQGVGALAVYYKDHGKQVRSATLVDIGSCTVDVVTIRWDSRKKDYVFVRGACDSDRTVSAATFKHAWLRRISKIDGLQHRDFGYFQLMRMAMENNLELRHRGDRIDLRPDFVSTRQEFTERIICTVRQTVKSLWDETEAVVLTGGGVELLDLSAWPDGRAIKLGVYANVIGQHLAVTGQIDLAAA